jgi:hypothetical protein
MGDPVSHRTGMDARVYYEAISPLLAKVLAAEAMTRGPLGQAWLRSAARELGWLTRRAQQNPGLAAFVREAIERDTALAGGLVAGTDNRSPIARHVVSQWLREALQPDLAALSALVAKPGGRTGHFASPSVFHELAAGRYPCSEFVQLRTVCTVMDAGDLVPAR